MLKNNIYNIDREFDYYTIKSIVAKSLEKIVKEEASKKKPDSFYDVIADNLDVSAHSTSSLKLKTFDDICNENNVTTIDLWDTNNGVSICYRCHKYVESLRTKLRNIFILRHIRHK
jgi:ethanolamine utilization protein EutQ (cupin superfamily)